jgi:hypothetical protein
LEMRCCARDCSWYEKRFRSLIDKERSEEPFSPEEEQFYRAYYERRTAAYLSRNPMRESTGLIPIPQLGKEKYQGEEGGLYPGGRNELPAGHVNAGLELARSIQPLDAEGAPSASGKIVLLSIGMSNTSLEFTAFRRLAQAGGRQQPAGSGEWQSGRAGCGENGGPRWQLLEGCGGAFANGRGHSETSAGSVVEAGDDGPQASVSREVAEVR